MINITKELKSRLLAAQSAEEAAAMMKEGGQEITPEETAHLWEEIKKVREQEGKALSVDELDAVSGGKDRDWVKDGCAATVEYGSWCSSNDMCYTWDVTYKNQPISLTCPKCGMFLYEDLSRPPKVDKWGLFHLPIYHVCKACGYTEFVRYSN